MPKKLDISRVLWYNTFMMNDTLTATNPYEIIDQMALKIAKLEKLVKYYESLLIAAKRQQFGASSERVALDWRQLNIFGNAPVAPPPEPEIEVNTYTRKKRKGKREEDLSGLPVERIDCELPEDERLCPECGASMEDIGVEVRRELELIPAKIIVKEYAAHAYACPDKDCAEKNDKVAIVKAEAPPPLIGGSLASPSLVASIVTQKYMNGTPLYRIEKGFQYDGVSISRQTMSNWVIQCSQNFLTAIYMLLIKFLLMEVILHADETTHQVLHEPGRRAQTKSFEWLYRSSGCAEHKIAIYEYQETRGHEHPKTFLNDFKGFLHTDGYEAYHNLPDGITVVGCWAHARRKWEKAYKQLPANKRAGTDAERGLQYIGALFDLERDFTKQKLPPEKRYEQRLEKSKPIADAFFAWAETTGALPKTPLGEAAGYALSQRKYLENVFRDGRLELSNNRAERSVKPFVIGRKNWLFSNTPGGAEASSVMYSIIETAKENGLHPYQYIKFLLEKLPTAKTSELETFLPWSETLPDCCRAPAKETCG